MHARVPCLSRPRSRRRCRRPRRGDRAGRRPARGHCAVTFGQARAVLGEQRAFHGERGQPGPEDARVEAVGLGQDEGGVALPGRRPGVARGQEQRVVRGRGRAVGGADRRRRLPGKRPDHQQRGPASGPADLGRELPRGRDELGAALRERGRTLLEDDDAPPSLPDRAQRAAVRPVVGEARSGRRHRRGCAGDGPLAAAISATRAARSLRLGQAVADEQHRRAFAASASEPRPFAAAQARPEAGAGDDGARGGAGGGASGQYSASRAGDGSRKASTVVYAARP